MPSTVIADYGLGGPVFESWWDEEGFLFLDASRPALGPLRPPIQWLPEYFLGGKAAGA